MFKKNMKSITILIVFFVSIMMVSTATAVPKTTSDQTKNLIEKTKIESLNIREKLNSCVEKIQKLAAKTDEDNLQTTDFGDGPLYMILSILFALFKEIFKLLANLATGAVEGLVGLVGGLFAGVVLLADLIIKVAFAGIVIVSSAFFLLINWLMMPILNLIDFLEEINGDF